jgi:hypothetical protein
MIVGLLCDGFTSEVCLVVETAHCSEILGSHGFSAQTKHLFYTQEMNGIFNERGARGFAVFAGGGI